MSQKLREEEYLMKTYQRTYHESDQEAVLQFLLETRTGKDLERYPTIWRLRQELATRLWEPERDAHIWENTQGQMLAAAALVSRTPDALSKHMEYLIHPQANERESLTEILTWAETRILEKAVKSQTPSSITIFYYADRKEQNALLEAHGYILNQRDYNLYMSCSLTTFQILPPKVEDFTIRSLDGLNELEPYMELFGFAAMTREHRSELLAHPNEYAHIVAVTPENKMVAYCEVSISRQEWILQSRQIGWVDYVGTKEEFQRCGLGHTLLLHGLRRLQDWGADRAMLITMGTNTTAQRAFKSVDFFPAEEGFYYEKQMKPR